MHYRGIDLLKRMDYQQVERFHYLAILIVSYARM